MKNKINLINEFVQKNRWIDIEFKNINHEEISLICGEDLDLPITKNILITFSNPSFIKSNLWIRSTLKETQNTAFISITSKIEAEQIMDRKLDSENNEFNIKAENLFKLQIDDEITYIAAEDISFKILN
jgi:hypothetical protein